MPERLRASAFAHSETVLMLACVAGGALGLIPFDGRLGVGAMAGLATLFAARAVIVAGQLRKERLHGRIDVTMEEPPPPDRPESKPEPKPEPTPTVPEQSTVEQPVVRDDDAGAPPGYHIYRPSKPVSQEPKE